MTLSLKPRSIAREPKLSVGYKTVLNIINENLELPAGWKLGECENMSTNFDNYSTKNCEATWVFNLETPEAPKKTSAPKKAKKEVS